MDAKYLFLNQLEIYDAVDMRNYTKSERDYIARKAKKLGMELTINRGSDGHCRGIRVS